jgi:hypothetical protein
MSSYLVYVCQAVMNRAGLERYWQVARYPENVDVLAGYAPFEVLDADQDERVEGIVLAEFPPFKQTVEWFNGDAYVQARKKPGGQRVSRHARGEQSRAYRQSQCSHACVCRVRLP